jgi:hypothetical protein
MHEAVQGGAGVDILWIVRGRALVYTRCMGKKTKKRSRPMTLSEAGRLGALKTNLHYTTEKRSAAAYKGWARRKQRLEEKNLNK